MLKLIVFIIGVNLSLVPWVQAELNISITGYVEDAVPIAVVPFGWKGKGRLPGDMAKIIANDLARSGQFKSMSRNKMASRPQQPKEVRFPEWRRLGSDYLVIGHIESSTVDRYRIRFYLFDVVRGHQVAAYTIPIRPRVFRKAAHRIADIVYEKITGEKGAFDTRIAYVTVEKKRAGGNLYRLKIADSDGHNAKTMITRSHSIMSPAWSPDGSKIAYVSFETKRPNIYIQEVATGRRQRLKAFKGINSAPAWSPDGHKLALVLSHGRNPDIHIYDVRSKKFKRITRHYAIDTEPMWSKDGRSIIFTSDRGGSVQLYEVPIAGGRAKRLTFEGNYNARPRLSADGRYLAMVHRERGDPDFQIGVLDRQDDTFTVLTNGKLDESPSFSPNGRMIIYAASGPRSRGLLAAVSVDGQVHQRLALQKGSVREPAWSPFSRHSGK